MCNKNVKRILYCQPQTNGDVFIGTGVVDSLKKKYPSANIYFATEKKYFCLLEDNPNIKGVIEYDDTMINYRNYETWGPQENTFDIVFCPFIVTQRIPHWLHSGHGEWIGRVYSDMCHVKYGTPYIRIDNIDKFDLPDQYITIHSQSLQDPKDFDKMPEVVKNIKNITKVQIGSTKDKKVDCDIDLRGNTTPQELAGIIKNARLHVGVDSFPMHIAGYTRTASIIVFGGTYKQQGINPLWSERIHAIEPESRGLCVSSCHLISCTQKENNNHDKCINSISPKKILKKIRNILGDKYVNIENDPVISSYIIIRDGIKYRFPIERCIEKAWEVSNKVIIVDGESTDETLEVLERIKKELDTETYYGVDGTCDIHTHNKIQIYKKEWDLQKEGFIGEAKAYAASLCEGSHRIQLDADELLIEPKPGMINRIIESNDIDCICLPVINLYGDSKHIRIENNAWKFRIYKNTEKITHGANAAARSFDVDTMKIKYNRNLTDMCDPIYSDSLEVVKHRPPLEAFRYLWAHEKLKRKEIDEEEYIEEMKKMMTKCPFIIHMSWVDLDRKLENAKFWDETKQGQEGWHNISSDISKRIKENEDYIVDLGFDLFEVCGL